jgi:PAS domain S-box-containing protein
MTQTALRKRKSTSRPAWVPYAAATGLIVMGWLARTALTPSVGPTAIPFIFFFPAVAVAAWIGGWKPGAFATALSVGAAHWFFTARLPSGAPAAFTEVISMGAFVVSCSFIIAAIQAMHRANGETRAEFTARERAETRLAAIVEHSGDAILTKNLDGIIQTWNASAQLLFGYRADEIVGRPITTLFPPDRLGEEDHILQRLRAGQPVERFETIRMAKDGRRIPVSISISPLRNSEGEVIGASKVVHDITALAAARDELVREKELLATTLASIGDGVVVTDAGGRVTFLNAEAERLTGWRTAEAHGQPLQSVFRIVNEQTRSPVDNPVEKVFRLGTAVGLANHTILIAKDGSETPIDDSAAPIRHGSGPLFGVVLVFRGIAEQRKVEAALRFNEQRARAFLDNSAIIAWLKDEDGRYVFQSENYMRRFGMHDWENKTDAELWPADVAEVFRKNDLAVLSGGTSLEVVEETRTPDGRVTHWLSSKFWFQDAAGKKYVGGVGVDITERLRVERTVREREAVLRTVTNESRVALVMVNEERRYLFANRAYAEILGVPDEDIVGQRVSDLPVPIHGQIEPCLDRAFGGERIRHELQLPRHAQTGRGHFYEVLYEPRLESDSGPYVVVALVDLTDRRRAEEALRSTAEELARSSRAKDEFLAALSHELRTPLTPVLMTAAAMERDPALPADAREQLAMMRHNIELEARLIDDLLDITRISRGKLTLEPAPVNIHQLLQNTAAIVRSDGQDKQVHLELQLQADRHHAMADAARLHQVFWNLLRNAFKFTPRGGRVTVTTENDDAGNIRIRVADTGMGIAPENLARIFNAFEQLENPGQRRADGLGLGLAISKSIVEMHEGEIHAESGGPGLGAAFHVKLATITEGPVPNSPESSDVPCRPLRLLVVEDHQATLSTLTRLLARDGHHITSATTIREALAAAATGHFDVLVSDLGLPDGSGLDLMRQIRRLRPISGIALSGFGMPEDLRQATEAGFFAHLVKPVDINQLRRLLIRVPAAEDAGTADVPP